MNSQQLPRWIDLITKGLNWKRKSPAANQGLKK